MRDLNFRTPRAIVEDGANNLRSLTDEICRRRFNPRLARVVDDNRDDERERDFDAARDSAAGALTAAEAVLRDFLNQHW